MQHLFEVYLKAKDTEQAIHTHYLTESSRYGKVAKQVLKRVNDLLAKDGLSPWMEGDLEDFRMKKLR